MRTGAREILYEVHLDYSRGARVEVTESVFALLEAADGACNLEELARGVNCLTDKVREELYRLWQQRMFTLLPRG
jgi:hypothetical protein